MVKNAAHTLKIKGLCFPMWLTQYMLLIKFIHFSVVEKMVSKASHVMGVPTDDSAAIPFCRFLAAVAAGAAVRGQVTARIQKMCSGKITGLLVMCDLYKRGCLSLVFQNDWTCLPT